MNQTVIRRISIYYLLLITYYLFLVPYSLIAMKIKFSTLISLTFVTVALLIPFVFSPWYLPLLRESNFDLHLVFQGELYKQITGYISLFFIIVEMILIPRKRGRSWKVKVKLPGSLLFWRSLHIFAGIHF